MTHKRHKLKVMFVKEKTLKPAFVFCVLENCVHCSLNMLVFHSDVHLPLFIGVNKNWRTLSLHLYSMSSWQTHIARERLFHLRHLSVTVYFIYYRGIVWCLCTIDSIGNQFLPWSRHLGVEIRKKRQLRLSARSVRQVCLLNKRPPSLLANQYFISQPLMSQPQPAPHKHETEVARPVPLALALTTSNSSESDSCSVCASIGAEETAARASQPRDEALNMSGEGRDNAVPVSTSADRSLCEPQELGNASLSVLAKERQAGSKRP